MTDLETVAADRMHSAIQTLLAHLATGGGSWGANPTLALRDLLESQEIQELSDAADGWTRV